VVALQLLDGLGERVAHLVKVEEDAYFPHLKWKGVTFGRPGGGIALSRARFGAVWGHILGGQMGSLWRFKGERWVTCHIALSRDRAKWPQRCWHKEGF